MKIEKLLAETSRLMGELDGGLEIDLIAICDSLETVYEVMDERKDNGDYHI